MGACQLFGPALGGTSQPLKGQFGVQRFATLQRCRDTAAKTKTETVEFNVQRLRSFAPPGGAPAPT